jgi:predicted nucleic acid-binding protein
MAGYFFDTSALAKHYHPETGTARVDAILSTASASHFISRLGAVELLSVFAGKVRTGAIVAADKEMSVCPCPALSWRTHHVF